MKHFTFNNALLLFQLTALVFIFTYTPTVNPYQYLIKEDGKVLLLDNEVSNNFKNFQINNPVLQHENVTTDFSFRNTFSTDVSNYHFNFFNQKSIRQLQPEYFQNAIFTYKF